MLSIVTHLSYRGRLDQTITLKETLMTWIVWLEVEVAASLHPFLNTAEFLAELERYTYIELAARNEDGRHIGHEPFG